MRNEIHTVRNRQYDSTDLLTYTCANCSLKLFRQISAHIFLKGTFVPQASVRCFYLSEID